jgi:nitrogen fixation/metabolism regulation signal transduction histidine kinase
MPSLTLAGYALIGITALMGVVLVVLLVSLLRLSRRSRGVSDNQAETSMMSTALQETLTRLKAQERAMAARAEASERLSGQIILGVAAGLIVVDRRGLVQIVNPAARRILSLRDGGEGQPIEVLIAHVGPLARAISETLRTGVPVARRQL